MVLNEIPIKIKINENPATNNNALLNMVILFFMDLFCISSIEIPLIYDIYGGISGKIQGLKKVKIPAKNEIEYGSFSKRSNNANSN